MQLFVGELVVTIRDELLEATSGINDGNRRVIAICRLSGKGRYQDIPGEVLRRAVFHACIEALKEEKERWLARRLDAV